MSQPASKKRFGSLSLAGEMARRSRAQAPAVPQPMRGRGGWSSLIRLTPCNEESGRRSPWPSLARLCRKPSAAPAFLCTDFAPSQWFKP
ncbi:hypothetical protein OOT46_11640 [Aquabacterium sp. A7-Y]|uniref:hypothetical protein n=1 Tax=Aquabacterium sp. A7-Y TaxID=1349605 RepID=UPI00223E3627|nr:hypothetical protein [Aquabacterium sp. A7-Y]MCW7538493.1 hypothetical protein [Aquabacterium sp. A7-Y]